MKWARRQKIADGNLTNVVARLAEYANPNGVSYPSQATLAARCGLTDRTVRAALKTLADLKIITRAPRKSRGRHGRSSDLIALDLSKDFEVSKLDIAATRRKFHAENGVVPSGKIFRGIITRLTAVPSQEEELQKVVIGDTRGRLRVIAGGRL